MKAKRQNTKSTFCVIFVIQKGKCRPDGTAPIVARITLNGEMVHFSTKLYIHPDRWLLEKPQLFDPRGQSFIDPL